MTANKMRLTVSVRDLVEFSLRRGDLNYVSIGRSNSIDAIRIHQKIQKGRPQNYQSEVAISRSYETDYLILEVNGRIDGIFESSDQVTIDEIKTTLLDLDTIANRPDSLHWGQVKTYACFYAFHNNLEQIGAQLTYYNLSSREIREIKRSFAFDELESFVGRLVSTYLTWLERVCRQLNTRNESIAKLEFPFKTYRRGQREMAIMVYKAVQEKGQVLIQAPTGVGKTMAALFPAIKAQGAGAAEKLFFLTARGTGKVAAEKALSTLRDNGLVFKSLTITAKDKICFNPDVACHAEECLYARGYYDRLKDALNEAFVYNCFTFDLITELCQKHQLCPFAFTLELSNYVDCIICDYNYVFDPRVYLRRFFSEGKKSAAVLVDEAHNLIDRARDMYSAELRKEKILELRRLLGGKQPRLHKIFGRLNSQFLNIKKSCELKGGRYIKRQLNSDLRLLIRKTVFALDNYLLQNSNTDFRKSLLEFHSSITQLFAVMERYDDNYVTLYELQGKDVRLRLFCLNPAKEMKKKLEQTISTSFLSATLTPAGYFKELLGCQDSAQAVQLPSPFPGKNQLTLIANHISTRFHHREKTKQKLCNLLSSFVRSKRGNYILFFPSYAYLNMIYPLFTNSVYDVKTIVQQSNFTEDERRHFLSQFSAQNGSGLVAFAVMGGIFGEGIDLVGEKLSGVAIIGVGLPGLSFERDLIRDAFAHPVNKGYEYAYQYPGINRVLQAAGRVIRTENDKGVILLVDDRFYNRQYRSLLPNYWQPKLIRDENDLNLNIKTFWDN